MNIYIKNMVSQRCKIMVIEALRSIGIKCVSIQLGVVEVVGKLTLPQEHELSMALMRSGLEVIIDTKAIITEKIKTAIIDMVHNAEEIPPSRFSEYLSSKLKYNYTYLANVFSEEKGITIQQYLIENRIERAKELLLYRDLTLTEISYKLHYSSVAHLSRQFKQVTGLTPRLFLAQKDVARRPLEDI